MLKLPYGCNQNRDRTDTVDWRVCEDHPASIVGERIRRRGRKARVLGNGDVATGLLHVRGTDAVGARGFRNGTVVYGDLHVVEVADRIGRNAAPRHDGGIVLVKAIQV